MSWLAGQTCGSVTNGNQLVGGLEPDYAGNVKRVAEGDTLLIVESMKMEVPLSVPVDGVVAELLAAQGEAVDRGRLRVRPPDFGSF